ncbi:MAG: DNA-directed DNA polymerase [Archaeoglobaceae archaeon]
MRGWLINADYITENGIAVIRLWCVDDQGPFVAYDRSFKPYFYALKEEGVRADELMDITDRSKSEVISPERVEELTLKSLGREIEAYKIYLKHPQHVPRLRGKVATLCEVREADIPFIYRYLIDKQLACMDGVIIEGEDVSDQRLRRYELQSVEREEKEGYPELKMMSFDCEMLTELGMPDPEKDPIIVIGAQYDDRVEILEGEDERDLLVKFIDLVKEIEPDVLVGYNQDNFDWPYIKKRAKKHNLKVDIGRDSSELDIRGRPRIAGRLNVDLYDIAMRTIDVKVKKLENIAEFLGRKEDFADIEAKDIHHNWTNGNRDSVKTYARQDVLNTHYIAEELLPMHFELSRMIRLPLDDVTRCGRGKQVDWLLLSEANQVGEVAPNPPEYATPYEGAFVLEPVRGLYENVVCLDFASMYPNIMISYNISPDTVNGSKEYFEAPEVKHRFKKEPDGFFKRILRMLIDRRKEIKEAMKKVDQRSPDYRLYDIKQSALKVLTNSFYGYMGWNLARWYCRECAEATTAWGRYFIKTSARIGEEMEFEVLYGDTDSIFVRKEGLSLDQLKEESYRLIEKLSEELPVHIEIEDFYSTVFFVEKKRYAGLTVDGNLVVKGLEVRRGDWCELAKKLQRNVIQTILKDKDPERAASYVKDIITEVKEGNVPLTDYVIYKGLTRRPERYEAVQAHVKAAKKASAKGITYPIGSKVGFVVTKGSGNIGDRAYPYDLIEDFDGECIVDMDGVRYRIDKEYYIENQILPSVLRILERFGYSESQIKGARQWTLDFFQ